MRKATSKFLVILLILNFFVSSMRPYEVYAATYNMGLVHSFVQGYTEGRTSFVPTRENMLETSDKVRLEWNFERAGVYYFTYFSDSNKKIILKAIKDTAGKVTLSYDVYNQIAGVWTKLPTSPDYQIHTAVGMAQDQKSNYISATSFFTGNYATPFTGSGFVIKNANEPATSTNFTALTPLFEVTAPDTGISFKYDQKNVHLKWDARMFYLLTDGISTKLKDESNSRTTTDPRVYDFNLLYRQSDDLAFDATFKLNNTGIASLTDADWSYDKVRILKRLANLSVIPVANYDNTVEKYMDTNIADHDIDFTNNAGTDSAANRYDNDPDNFKFSSYMDLTTAPVVKLGTNPELIVRYDIPQVIDLDTGTYIPIPASDPNDIRLDFDFKNYASTDKNFRATTDNILDAASNTNATTNSNINVRTERVANNTDRAQAIFKGMEPSQIYDMSITIIDKYNGPAKKTTIINAPSGSSYGNAFTFLKYSFQIMGDVFNIIIEPYQGVKGYYMLVESKDLNNLKPNTVKKGDGTGEILISLPLSKLGEFYYEIFFSIDDPFGTLPDALDRSYIMEKKYIYSQIAQYVIDPSLVMVGAPKSFNVIDYELVPRNQPADGSLSDLNLHLSWDILDKTSLEALVNRYGPGTEITYRLYSALSPNPATDTDREKITDITLILSTGTDGKLQVEYKLTGIDGADGGSLIDPLTKKALGIREDSATYRADLVLSLDAARVGHETNELFLYPNIYFLDVAPILIKGPNIASPTDLGEIKSLHSQSKSITLNDPLTLEPPAATNLIIRSTATDIITSSTALGDPYDEVSFKPAWKLPGAAYKYYFDNTFPATNTDVELTMNIYISQDESTMLAAGVSTGTNVKNKFDVNKIKTIDYVSNPFYFSKIGTNVPMAVNGGGTPTDFLRDKKVIKIQNVPLDAGQVSSLKSGATVDIDTYKFDGLDKNQKYYVYVELVAVHDLGTETDTRYSKLSNLLVVTTKGDKDIPSEKEKYPSAPENLKVDETGLDYAKISWDAVKPNVYSDAETILNGQKTTVKTEEIIEYEIIRTKDKQLDSKLLNLRDDTFKDFYKLAVPSGVESAGFRTDSKSILEYNSATGEFATATNAGAYEYNTEKGRVSFKDGNLMPNVVYFYYVRTVRTIKRTSTTVNVSTGEIVASSVVLEPEKYSTWSGISATTTPVKSPMNLVVERARKDYDKQKEVIISFDAPITDLTKLGVEYDLVYTLKADTGDWSADVIMDAALLKAAATTSAMEGYSHFEYKITGLKMGTNYFIKVRMIDKKSGDASLYTNIAEARTEIDPEEYDNKVDTDKWTNLLKQELQVLVKDYYWITRDTANELEVVYRPSMFSGLLGQSADGLLALVSGDASHAAYYLPASAWITANGQNKGFKVTHGDMEVIISPNAIDNNYNDAIIAISEKIKTKDIADYYIKITLNWTRPQVDVDGSDILGSQVEVIFEAVGSTQNSLTWDNDIYAQLLIKLAEEGGNTSYLKSLQDKVKDNVKAEELAKAVDAMVKSVKNDFIKDAADSFNKIKRTSYKVQSLDKAIMIVIKGLEQEVSVAGYQKQADQWVSKDVVPFGANKAIYTNLPGIYIFTGKKLNLPGLENVPNAQVLTGIITKYGLDDFLGKDGNFNLESSVSKNAAAGTVARLLGAPKGANSAAWLNEKGISLTNRNQADPISNQEAIYLVMYLYESKTKTKISTMKIRNYNLTSGIIGMDEKYKKSIQAAFELGIYKDKKMLPKGTLKMKEFLEMLSAVNQKTKL